MPWINSSRRRTKSRFWVEQGLGLQYQFTGRVTQKFAGNPERYTTVIPPFKKRRVGHPAILVTARPLRESLGQTLHSPPRISLQ